MKKIIFILMCLVSLTTSAQHSNKFFSTEKTDSPITVGIRGGINISTLTEGDGDDFSSRAGFHAGFVVDVPIVKSLSLQLGLYYTIKGFNSQQQFSTEEIDREYFSFYNIKSDAKATLQYIEMPILASYHYDFNDAIQLQFNVGPYIAYGVGGKAKRTIDTNGYDGFYDINGEKHAKEYVPSHDEQEDKFFDYDYANRFDAGLYIGAGIMFSKHIYFGVAYEMGFTSIIDDMDGYKNRNLTISAGYQF